MDLMIETTWNVFNQGYIVICERNFEKFEVYERILKVGLGFDVKRK